MSRRTLALVAAYVVMFAAFAAAAVMGYAIGQHDATPADITVMPCTAWANDANPQIPANTLTDACVDDAGTLHTAPTSLEKTR